MQVKKIILKNNMNVSIREANVNDAENFHYYLMKIGSETDNLTFGSEGYPSSIDDKRQFIYSTISSSNSLFLFCIYNDNIIGCIDFHGGIQKRLEHTGMFAISVLKEYWNLGIGRILLESLIEWAKLSKKIKKINLKVKEDNDKAINLYKKYGFKEEGKISRDFYLDGKFYSSLEMGLEI